MASRLALLLACTLLSEVELMVWPLLIADPIECSFAAAEAPEIMGLDTEESSVGGCA